MSDSTPGHGTDRAPHAGDRPAADVGSIDAIVAALYEAVSFEPHGTPDWDRLASLFHPEGRLVPPRADDSEPLPMLGVEEFARLSTEYIQETGLRGRGFHEREIGRETARFGNVAHLFSAYESLHTPRDEEPFSRGINSIQVEWDRGRWWVLGIVWDEERPDNPIPERYGA